MRPVLRHGERTLRNVSRHARACKAHHRVCALRFADLEERVRVMLSEPAPGDAMSRDQQTEGGRIADALERIAEALEHDRGASPPLLEEAQAACETLGDMLGDALAQSALPTSKRLETMRVFLDLQMAINGTPKT